MPATDEKQAEARRIVEAMDGPTAVARIFGIRPQAVSQWLVEGIPQARLQTLRLMRPDLVTDDPRATEAQSAG